jgi:serine/threonine protein phosphatase PrpC
MNVTTSAHAGYTARRKPPTAEGVLYTEDHSARFEVGEYRFFCVFDGHGGDETSSALARIVPRLARELFESMEAGGSVEAGLLLLFERIDAEIATSGLDGLTKGGATCNVTVVHAPTMVMTVASLGDSPTLVYERRESHERQASHESHESQEPYVLAFRTKDQDCADEEEQARLRALGLYVFEQRVVAPDGSTHATGVVRCRTAGGTETATMSSFGDAAHDVPRGAVNKVPRVYPGQRIKPASVVLVCSDGCMEHLAPFSHTLIKPSADARADEIAGHIGDYFGAGGSDYKTTGLAAYITERQIESIARARHGARGASGPEYDSDRAWVEREFDNQTVFAIHVD